MFRIIFPSRFDNSFHGHKAALWLFYLITVMTLGRSLVHIFLADGGAQSIATIPLDRFSGDGAAAVVFVFALWGLSQLLLGLIMALAAIRYRSMIPLMYVVILLEYLGRIGIGQMKTLVTTGTPPGAPANLVLIALSVIGLLLIARGAGQKQGRE